MEINFDYCYLRSDKNINRSQSSSNSGYHCMLILELVAYIYLSIQAL